MITPRSGQKRFAPVRFALSFPVIVFLASALFFDNTANAAPPDFAARNFIGKIEVVVADDLDNDRSETHHYLRDQVTGSLWRLRFTDGVSPALRPGSRVSVNARRHGDELLLAANGLEQIDGETTYAAATGPQAVLVMVADFTDASVACPIGDIESLMFSASESYSVSTLYSEMSSGAVSLDGDVAGPFAINYSSTSCSPSGWANALDQQAEANGVDLTLYPRKVYVVPTDNSCGYSGLGSVGGPSSQAWVLRCHSPDVYAHELGHNLGFGHAATPTSEYGDSSSIMGFAGFGLRHSNAAHLDRIGWNSSAQTITTSGQYSLAPLYGNADAARVLTLHKPDTDEYYYLSYREGVGGDSGLAYTYKNRLTVHRHSGGSSANKSYLLGTFGDGQSFVDEANNISVTQLSHDASGATLSISLNSQCVTAAPTVAVSPSLQTGTPQQQLDYDVIVSSGDSASCGPREFYAQAVSPGADWAATVSPAVLTLAPGESANSTMSVVSGTTASGDNTIVVDVTASAESASAAVVYRVAATCQSAPYAVTLSPTQRTTSAGSSADYTFTVANNDSVACAASTVSLGASAPGGDWSAVVVPAQLQLDPGESASATLTVTAPAAATPGSYTTDVSAQGASGSLSVTATTVIEETAGSDDTPPSTPTALSAYSTNKYVRLSWNASSDNVGIAGYRIFRNGIFIAASTETVFSDRGGISGRTYEYSVSAYDVAGNLSSRSAPVAAGKTRTTTKGGGGGKGNGKGPGK